MSWILVVGLGLFVAFYVGFAFAGANLINLVFVIVAIVGLFTAFYVSLAAVAWRVSWAMAAWMMLDQLRARFESWKATK